MILAWGTGLEKQRNDPLAAYIKIGFAILKTPTVKRPFRGTFVDLARWLCQSCRATRTVNRIYQLPCLIVGQYAPDIDHKTTRAPISIIVVCKTRYGALRNSLANMRPREGDGGMYCEGVTIARDHPLTCQRPVTAIQSLVSRIWHNPAVLRGQLPLLRHRQQRATPVQS